MLGSAFLSVDRETSSNRFRTSAPRPVSLLTHESESFLSSGAKRARCPCNLGNNF